MHNLIDVQLPAELRQFPPELVMFPLSQSLYFLNYTRLLYYIIRCNSYQYRSSRDTLKNVIHEQITNEPSNEISSNPLQSDILLKLVKISFIIKYSNKQRASAVDIPVTPNTAEQMLHQSTHSIIIFRLLVYIYRRSHIDRPFVIPQSSNKKKISTQIRQLDLRYTCCIINIYRTFIEHTNY